MSWQETPCIPCKRGYGRIIWIKANGPIPNGLCVCHYCDNTRCRNLNHMWLGTQSQNIKDCVSKGRHNNKGKPSWNRGQVYWWKKYVNNSERRSNGE